jgi:general secretion pathway protein D
MISRNTVFIVTIILLFTSSLFAQGKLERAPGPPGDEVKTDQAAKEGSDHKGPPGTVRPPTPPERAAAKPDDLSAAAPKPTEAPERKEPPQKREAPAPRSGPGARMASKVPVIQPGGKIKMNFDNVELRDLIRFIANVMGKNFLFDENVVKGRVTVLSPNDLTKDEVFRLFVTTMNYFGFAVVPTPEAIKVVRQADARGMAIQKLDRSTLADLPPEDRFMTYVHTLEYLDSTVMVGVLKPMMSKDAHIVGIPSTNTVIMIDTASNIQRIRKILTEVDIPISKQLGSLKVYNVQHTNAVDLAKTIQGLLSESKKAQTPKEKIFVTSYASTNALLISAPPEDMMEIERIISELDTLRPQVYIEAAIMEVTTTKGEAFGLESLVSGSTVAGAFVNNSTSYLVPYVQAILTGATTNAGLSTAIGTLSGFNVGVTSGSYTGLIRALSTLENVNILSTPQLLTVNNEEAEIIVGENRPYQTSSRLDAAGNPTYSYEYKDVGIKLKIKPQINKDGFVNLSIYQEVSQISTTSTTGALAPTTLKRSTKTTVVVKDSQTVVISGLIKDNLTASSQGIPFLSSIPIIGYLFGSKTKTNEKTNLLVFLTPRIVYTAEHLGNVTDMKKQEQEKMLFQPSKKP